MPALCGVAAGRERQTKKRSKDKVASGIITALLILIVTVFTCGSLWLGIFAIPAFFAFFRASVVTVSSIREGVNQLQDVVKGQQLFPFRSLRLGAACGLALTIIAGGFTIFVLEMIKLRSLDGNGEDAFMGLFRIFGAIVFTHMAASVLKQGSRTPRSAVFYQEKIKAMALPSDPSDRPGRRKLFYLGLGASLQEGVASFLYMLPLGGAYTAKDVPLPAVLGVIAGLLAARHLAPALVWGGVGESDGIRPDSGAASWSERREVLTDEYVSRLAALATGRAALSGDGDELESSQNSTEHPGSSVSALQKSLSKHSAGALKEIFRDSMTDPEHFDQMNYEQKRLIVLKSSNDLRSPDEDSDCGSGSDSDDEPAILSLQDSSEWGSLSFLSAGASISGGVGGSAGGGAADPIAGDHTSTRQSMPSNNGRLPSLVSIAEDADGYIDRGGYSDDEAVAHRLPRSAKGAGIPSRNASVAEASVRFRENYSDDGTHSSMDSFQHRFLKQAGSRDARAELEVMEASLSQRVQQKISRKIVHQRLGYPRGRVHDTVAPAGDHSLAESVGGDIDLDSPKESKRRLPFSMHWGLRWFTRHSGKTSMSDNKTELQDEKTDEDGAVAADAADDDDEEKYYSESSIPGEYNAIVEDVAKKSFLATVALSISAFVIFLCCAGLFKLGVLDFKNASSSSSGTEVFNMCGCCTANQDGSEGEVFFAISSAISNNAQLQVLLTPERRTAAQAQKSAARGLSTKSMESRKLFLGGEVPDPAIIQLHPSHFWIKLSAVLNVGTGVAYISWRASRSMPENPVSPLWNWLFFIGECILTVGVWTSHLQRAFPSIRETCTMDDLVHVDSSVATTATVCIMVPTLAETTQSLTHVLLGAYSQRLWPTDMDRCRQLRIVVLDESGRHEVRKLVEMVYRLAEELAIESVHLAMCSKLNEPTVSVKILMDYFNHMDILDKSLFSEECHPAFEIATRMANYTRLKTNRLARGSSSRMDPKEEKKKKPEGPATRLEEGFKELFNTSSTIPSMMYSARKNPGTPKASPKAGNMNAAIFPNSPGVEPVIGEACRIVVVNDARHRLKTEFLQRTVPYFFKLDRTTGKNYKWADVGFVQTPQRFENNKDGDPLGNHAVLTFFVSNVSKDGVGGVTSCGQGSLWRVDALRGMAADGTQTVDSVKSPNIIGHDCGFRSEVLIEDTHTSLEFFKQQWRSAYVFKAGESLAVCVLQPGTVAHRVKQVFRWHIGAVQLLVKDGPWFVCTSSMPTVFHKMFGLDSITYYVQAVGGFFIILMPIMFSIFQETPFDTVDLEFIYFFFPYIITATIPTILALDWNNVNPNRVLTDEQFWLSTCYVQIWALVVGVWNKLSHANPDNAWHLKCPVWPLGLLFGLLVVSAVNTTVYWALYLEFDRSGVWIFVASFGACLVVMYSIWPMVKLWWPGWVVFPSAYHQKFCYILIFIALTSVLATFM